MLEFAKTTMGSKFFNKDFPALIEALKNNGGMFHSTTTNRDFVADASVAIAAGIVANNTINIERDSVASKALKIAVMLETLINEHHTIEQTRLDWAEYSGSCPDENCSGGVDTGWCDQCGEEYLEKPLILKPLILK